MCSWTPILPRPNACSGMPLRVIRRHLSCLGKHVGCVRCARPCMPRHTAPSSCDDAGRRALFRMVRAAGFDLRPGTGRPTFLRVHQRYWLSSASRRGVPCIRRAGDRLRRWLLLLGGRQGRWSRTVPTCRSRVFRAGAQRDFQPWGTGLASLLPRVLRPGSWSSSHRGRRDVDARCSKSCGCLGSPLGVRDDQSSDVFGAVGDDCVSAGLNHPGGRPINISTIKTGGLHRPVDAITPCTRSITVTRYLLLSLRPRPKPCEPWAAVGVGHQEQAVTCVWGTHGAR